MSDKACPFGHLGLLAACLSFMIGLVVSGLFIKQGLQEFRTSDRVVTVKGLAERNVEADLAVWTLSNAATGDVLSDVQKVSEANRQAIEMYLDNIGFGVDEISYAPLQVQDLLAQAYRPNNVRQGGRYIITQRMTVRTSDMNKISKAVAELGSLLKQNVTLTNMQPPTYIFTDLNTIKPEMLAEAVQNARKSAQEFATDSGANVGGIKRAYQGLFQILPRDPINYVSEQNQRFKRVRVVSTVDFYIE